MKKLLLFLVIVMLLSACQTATQDTDADIAPTEPTLALSYEDNIYFVLVDRFNDSNANLPDVAISGKLKDYYSDEKIESSGTLSIEMEPVSALIFVIELAEEAIFILFHQAE
mgnify:CR=1 FL=1